MVRYAIWTAVSTKPQAAEDQVSLPDQEKECHRLALAKGWVETAGPFVVPGESRTRWINLRDAENAIPALKDMLDSAQRGDFDVLVLWNYNRLRELLDPVARTLQAYRVQLYALSQPVEPQPPDEYDPLASDTANIVQFTSGFTSRAELSEFRRRYKKYMPLRILNKGLPKGRPPYGFRKPPGRETDRKAVPIQDPVKAAVVVRIKDLFLSGQSLWQIAHLLTADGVPTPAGKREWHDVNVRLILKNDFYSGLVTFGRTRRLLDPRTGAVKIVENDAFRIVVAKGAHQPLWDEATQRRIEDEFHRRGKKYTGIRTQRLSNLLYCGVCQARVWVAYPGGYSEAHRRWICSRDSAHVSIRDSDLLPRVIRELVSALERTDGITVPQSEDRTPLLHASLSDLQARRDRLTDALEVGSLDPATYATRVKSIEQQLSAVQRDLDAARRTTEQDGRRRAALETLALAIKNAPDALQRAPAQQVNAQFRQLLEKIVITPASTHLVFR